MLNIDRVEEGHLLWMGGFVTTLNGKVEKDIHLRQLPQSRSLQERYFCSGRDTSRKPSGKGRHGAVYRPCKMSRMSG